MAEKSRRASAFACRTRQRKCCSAARATLLAVGVPHMLAHGSGRAARGERGGRKGRAERRRRVQISASHPPAHQTAPRRAGEQESTCHAPYCNLLCSLPRYGLVRTPLSTWAQYGGRKWPQVENSADPPREVALREAPHAHPATARTSDRCSSLSRNGQRSRLLCSAFLATPCRDLPHSPHAAMPHQPTRSAPEHLLF